MIFKPIPYNEDMLLYKPPPFQLDFSLWGGKTPYDVIISGKRMGTNKEEIEKLKEKQAKEISKIKTDTYISGLKEGFIEPKSKAFLFNDLPIFNQQGDMINPVFIGDINKDESIGSQGFKIDNIQEHPIVKKNVLKELKKSDKYQKVVNSEMYVDLTKRYNELNAELASSQIKSNKIRKKVDKITDRYHELQKNYNEKKDKMKKNDKLESLETKFNLESDLKDSKLGELRDKLRDIELDEKMITGEMLDIDKKLEESLKKISDMEKKVKFHEFIKTGDDTLVITDDMVIFDKTQRSTSIKQNKTIKWKDLRVDGYEELVKTLNEKDQKKINDYFQEKLKDTPKSLLEFSRNIPTIFEILNEIETSKRNISSEITTTSASKKTKTTTTTTTPKKTIPISTRSPDKK